MSVAIPQTNQSPKNLKKMHDRAWRNEASINAPPPTPPDLTLRHLCDGSLEHFLRAMFPLAFPLEFSPEHIRMISEIERTIVAGGLKTIVAPRGTGKTSILLRSGLWGILTGHRRYICIVAAEETSAVSNLGTLKTEINFNPQLCETYGHETWCLRQLNGEPRRAGNQVFNNQPTGVQYERNTLGFGTLPDSVTSGAVITTAGITGRIRGQQSLTMGGEIIRPDFVLVDDPSTKLSAASLTQNKKRLETMNGDILGLAGPGVKIAGFCSATVIYKDDLADNLLDRNVSPDWNGDRVQMIKKWPDWMEGWEEYNQIRIEEIQAGKPPTLSTEFVREHFDRLHEGAEVYWEARKGSADLSAMQHAMDLYFRDAQTFYSEYMNDPLQEGLGNPYEIDANVIARRICGLGRSQVPNDVDKITAFIDVQNELLYYMVMAWTTKGRGHIIDMGACPDQKRFHWTKSTVQNSLSAIFGDEFETYIRSGLEWLIDAILTNEYTTEKGGIVNVDKLCIDGRWGESTKIIRDMVRESKHRAKIHLSMGMYVGVNSKKWQQLKAERRPGDRKKRIAKGIHAKFVVPEGGGRQELMYDTNFWKTIVAERLLCPIGSPKAIVLFAAKPHEHLMFGEHCACEEPFRMQGKAGNVITEWKQPEIGSPDNDYWDCLTGNAALASTLGVELLIGNKRKGTQLTKAINDVLKRKPDNQFFRRRR